ncbi:MULTISPECIES: bifunctional (p)ppGpp synthetase/guanosine-3',5'-bis(diphosphate) 3'-pyrophosphohydrolase [Rhodomicrobium]|uniref:RelA/SpoT family protein n=1 Tax=Rhodomicrobium TaxID=1068 RepID=UPI000B4B1307|nr:MULTISPECIES: bifunctional (p)ppGpp synthetase/guanosine-3',5'-bis(diphosphate) 3'-pyrophosphohydrolase [Rhodomicrobium]
MMRQYELVEKVLSYDPNADEALLNRAYVYAMKAHGHQKRASGDPYFSHPLEVAAILTEFELDDATIATALLHDTIEDTGTTKAEIDDLFGAEIGTLVDGLTKIDKLNLVSKRAEQAENFRKLLIAISSDIRVLLVKLADRLHNMRTLEHKSPESRRRNAQETMDIYAPLAGRMGIQEMKDELEELAFRWLHTQAYDTLVGQLAVLRQRNKNIIQTIEQELRAKLVDAGVTGKVSSREKKPYSIWRKMENKQISLEQLSDIYGFRVVVDKLEDCYRVLGAVHTTWRTVPGRFKDYISTPKYNNYQSIHTTIVGPGHQRVELQIRTKMMEEIAEFGVAAHSLYKDGVISSNGNLKVAGTEDSTPYQWLRKLVANLLEGDNPEEFLEHTKLELFQDQVFCFTPKGRLIALPRGSTPIDFAYAVHTKIGHSCVGAKVNGRHMPLISELKNGDEVSIITSDAQTPPPAWENIVRTGKARSAIRRATREAVRKQYGNLGRDILKATFQQHDKSYSDEAVAIALGRLPQKTLDDVLAEVGRGEMNSIEVYRAVFPKEVLPEVPKRKAIKRSDEGWFNLRRVTNLRFRWPGSVPEEHSVNGANGVPIRGARGDLPIKFAPGGAIPGERIVGILEPGAGITIYPIHSPLLRDHFDHNDRWIDVTWDIDEASQERFPVKIKVTAVNEPGSLAKIAAIIGDKNGNIDKLQMTGRREDYTDMLIDVEVWDVKNLRDIMGGLKGLSAVSSVERIMA